MTMNTLTRAPVWAKFLSAIVVMAAVAGIPVFGAGITGDNPVKVQEPLTFADTSGTTATRTST